MADFEDELLNDPAFLQAGEAGLIASSSDSEPILRFFDMVRSAALEALDKGPAEGERMAFMVMSEQPRQEGANVGAVSRVVDLNLHPPASWQDRLIFVAGHGTSGWSMALPGQTSGEVIQWLEDRGLGDRPLAIAYFDRRTLSCYPEGGMSDAKPINLTLPNAGKVVSLPDILAVLEDVRVNSLLTPMVGPPKFWNEPAKYVPGPEAERVIRWIVAAQLRSTFRPMQVDIEHVCAVGSVDILMTPPARPLDGPRHAAVIELKALKSFTSGASKVSAFTNAKAVYKGHRQARAYRDVVQAGLGVMAAFDLRKVKTDTSDEAWDRARRMYFPVGDTMIEARRFPVYGTTDDAQEAQAA